MKGFTITGEASTLKRQHSELLTDVVPLQHINSKLFSFFLLVIFAFLDPVPTPSSHPFLQLAV
jgi:hypothetical protein